MVIERGLDTDLAAELRAEFARRQIAIYRLAPQVGLYPSRLGQILRGRRHLSPELAEKLWTALNTLEAMSK